MNLNEKFRALAVERSLSRNTQQNYLHWFKQFYGFCKVPASQWTPDLVRAWLLHLHDQNYSPVDALARPVPIPTLEFTTTCPPNPSK